MPIASPSLARSDSAASHEVELAARGPSAPPTSGRGPVRSDSARSLTAGSPGQGRRAQPSAAQRGAGPVAPALPAVAEGGRRRPWLRYVVGSGLGAGSFAALSYGINRLVQYKAVHAQVNADPAHWSDLAHCKYSAYYDGCGDCDDVDWSSNAYAYIRDLRVAGTLCDAAAMWFWPAADRFPSPCLQALGGILRTEALVALQHKQRDYYTLIIPAAAAGVGVFLAATALGRYAQSRWQDASTTQEPA